MLTPIVLFIRCRVDFSTHIIMLFTAGNHCTDNGPQYLNFEGTYRFADSMEGLVTMQDRSWLVSDQKHELRFSNSELIGAKARFQIVFGLTHQACSYTKMPVGGGPRGRCTWRSGRRIPHALLFMLHYKFSPTKQS